MRCFVIGPIGEQLAEPGSPERQGYEEAVQVFEEVIKAACKAFDIEAYRADDIEEPGDIPEQIFEALRDEELVIADLTGANPNVMYELGIRHVLGKCTLQIGERGRLPFDINTIRTVQFVRTPNGLIKARNALTKMIGSSLANGCKPSTAARVLAEGVGVAAEPDLVDAATSATEDEEPLGFLDAMADVETAMPEMNDRLNAMAELIVEFGELASGATAQQGRSTTASQSLAILKRFSKVFTDLVRRYDQELVEFESRVATIGAGLDVVLAHIEQAPDRAEANEFLDVVINMGAAAAAARDEGVVGFGSSLEAIENISRDLRPAVRLLRTDIDRTIASFTEVDRWGERAAEIFAPDDASGLE